MEEKLVGCGVWAGREGGLERRAGAWGGEVGGSGWWAPGLGGGAIGMSATPWQRELREYVVWGAGYGRIDTKAVRYGVVRFPRWCDTIPFPRFKVM